MIIRTPLLIFIKIGEGGSENPVYLRMAPKITRKMRVSSIGEIIWKKGKNEKMNELKIQNSILFVRKRVAADQQMI